MRYTLKKKLEKEVILSPIQYPEPIQNREIKGKQRNKKAFIFNGLRYYYFLLFVNNCTFCVN